MKLFKFNQKPSRKLLLDPNYFPMILGNNAFLDSVEKAGNPEKISIAIERSNGQIATTKTFIFNESEHQFEANYLYIERLVKTLVWLKGGWKIIFGGPKDLGERLKRAYHKGGEREFDADFMAKIYENDFIVEVVDVNQVPDTSEVSKPLGRHLDGYRIGFDAGGSDRKVSAVVNGESIYSEEVVWHPKLQSDPNYHYEGILDSMKRAASKMERVDAIGVSAAGIYIDKRVSAASLFLKVPQDKFDKEVRDMFLRIAHEMGDVPIEVSNDGDVTALAGAMSLGSNRILGIAMGTSEAAGYVDEKGNITGWLNELAFVPVDYNKDSLIDEWSLDYGCGVKYFSQDSVIKLAKPAGIELDENLSPAEKLKVVQKLLEEKDPRAESIFDTIGCYLGYSIAYYAEFYDIEHILVLGRVTSKDAGNRILLVANKVLEEEFNELYHKIKLILPDEKSRRVGQSIAAASLPKI
jgi:predicted NBD/HSP70 family sugar kinase